ncbi:MAG: lysyl oxidase family protein, partial [bacterium]
ALVRVPDLDGAPDLFIRQDSLASSWKVTSERIAAGSCTAIEAGVTPGVRRLLRFTVVSGNKGDADVLVGDPIQHIQANDGLFEYAPCHNHYHFKHFATYELVDLVSGKVWRASKHNFCMRDDVPLPVSMGGVPARTPYFSECGTLTDHGNQGISYGWSDIYDRSIPEQFIVLDDGDGQDPVPPGTYILRATVNPPFTETPQDPCRVLDTATGFCHQFMEADYANNASETSVIIPP